MLTKQSPQYQIFSSELDQLNTTTFRYLVLSSPRTGSSMLCSALRSTNMAGIPFEYFHAEGIKTWLVRHPNGNFLDFIVDLEKRRTTKNGYFGVKVHFNQWNNLYTNNNHGLLTNYLRGQDKIILVTRRNKIRQAISCLVAQQSNIWQIEIDENRNYEVPEWQDSFSFIITRLLYQLSSQEIAWKKLLHDNKIEFFELAYEDMIDGSDYLSDVLGYLNLNREFAASHKATTKKVSSDYDDIYENYKASIGFN